MIGVIHCRRWRTGSSPAADRAARTHRAGGQTDDGSRLQAVDQVRRQKPSGIALTVIEIVLSACEMSGTEVSEYERHVQRPSTSTPIPTYWPAA